MLLEDLFRVIVWLLLLLQPLLDPDNSDVAELAMDPVYTTCL